MSHKRVFASPTSRSAAALVGQQAIVPQVRGASVMLAPALDVMHLEAVALKIRGRHPDVVKFAAGKDIAGHRAGFLAVIAHEFAIGAFRRARDGVMQINPPAFSSRWIVLK